LSFDSRGERLLELLHLIRDLLGTEFVVDDLERTGLLHNTVYRVTIWTKDSFTRDGIYRFAKRLALHVFEVRSAEAFKELASVLFF
jgi:hypothetical protein